MTQENAHILVTDDDRDIRELVARYLKPHGYRISLAADGVEMKSVLKDHAIDLVILDIMMPGEDGLTLCRAIRDEGELPVIFISALGDDADRIVGLEMGGDDYLPKPFNPRELLARIKTVLRRTRQAALAPNAANVPDKDGWSFDGWFLDVNRHVLVAADGNEQDLSGGEYDLLLALVERSGRVLNRDQLLDLARGRDSLPFDRAIDVQISRLRKKLGDDARKPSIIKTVRGGGYMFAPPVVKGRPE